MLRAPFCSLGLQTLSLESPDATPPFQQLISVYFPLAEVSSFDVILIASVLQESLLIFQCSVVILRHLSHHF